MAPFGDVLLALEDSRQRAWLDRSPKHVVGQNKGHRGSCNQIDTLPNSHSQPIYVPGKYSVSKRCRSRFGHPITVSSVFRNLQPSSCLSDKEEDEIYGFGYGVFAPRAARNVLQSVQCQMPQQNSLPNSSTNVPVTQHPQQQHHHQQQQQRSVSGISQVVCPKHIICHEYEFFTLINFLFVSSCLSPRSAYFYELPPAGQHQFTLLI
jgi:SAM and SH3 domain-containing protein 1